MMALGRFERAIEEGKCKNLGAWKDTRIREAVCVESADWPLPRSGRFRFLCVTTGWIDTQSVANDGLRPRWRWPRMANDSVSQAPITPPNTGRPRVWVADAGYL